MIKRHPTHSIVFDAGAHGASPTAKISRGRASPARLLRAHSSSSAPHAQGSSSIQSTVWWAPALSQVLCRVPDVQSLPCPHGDCLLVGSPVSEEQLTRSLFLYLSATSANCVLSLRLPRLRGSRDPMSSPGHSLLLGLQGIESQKPHPGSMKTETQWDAHSSPSRAHVLILSLSRSSCFSALVVMSPWQATAVVTGSLPG